MQEQRLSNVEYTQESPSRLFESNKKTKKPEMQVKRTIPVKTHMERYSDEKKRRMTF